MLIARRGAKCSEMTLHLGRRAISAVESYGSVNATRESPSSPASRTPWPPAEITRYCLLFGPRNVIGVARALVGSAPFQSSSPLVTSKARIAE